jgi:hypothetical protein
MSQSVNVGSDLQTVSNLPAIPGFQVIVGDEGALSRESIEFNAVLDIAVNAGTGSLDFDLFEHLANLNPLASRVSAIVEYPLNVSLNYQFSDNPTIISASGAAAIRYPRRILGFPTTVSDVLACVGHVSFNLTQAGAVISGSLRPPAMIANDILVTQIMGHNPIICVRLYAAGISHVYLTVSGRVALRGVGVFNPF